MKIKITPWDICEGGTGLKPDNVITEFENEP